MSEQKKISITGMLKTMLHTTMDYSNYWSSVYSNPYFQWLTFSIKKIYNNSQD